MAENRLNRELDTREKLAESRLGDALKYYPLHTPEDGYAYRWVRVSTFKELSIQPMYLPNFVKVGNQLKQVIIPRLLW